jgi:hypothetical protein
VNHSISQTATYFFNSLLGPQNTLCKVALALAAGFSLGAGAIHGLHAAASPPAYVINEITVKDEDGYKKDFLPGAQKAIDDNGGEYIAAGFNNWPAASGPRRHFQVRERGQSQGMAGRGPQCAREDRQPVRHLPHVRSGRGRAILNAQSSDPTRYVA